MVLGKVTLSVDGGPTIICCGEEHGEWTGAAHCAVCGWRTGCWATASSHSGLQAASALLYNELHVQVEVTHGRRLTAGSLAPTVLEKHVYSANAGVKVPNVLPNSLMQLNMATTHPAIKDILIGEEQAVKQVSA